MAISISSDPQVQKMVSDSSKNLKRAKKTSKASSIIVPAVLTYDAASKAKAKKRGLEFWQSNDPEVAKQYGFINRTIAWREDHTENYGLGPGWKDEYRRIERNKFMDDKMASGAGIDKGQRAFLLKQVNEDIEDDIVTRSRLLDLSNEFALSADETAAQKRTSLYAPYNKARMNQFKNIVNNSGVIRDLGGLFTGSKKYKEGDSTPQTDSMASLLKEMNRKSNEWDEATGKYEAAKDNNKMSNLFITKGDTGAGPLEVTGKFAEFSTLAQGNVEKDPRFKGDTAFKITWSDDESGKSGVLQAYDMNNRMSKTTKQAFWTQVGMIASANKYVYDKTFADDSSMGIKTFKDFMQNAIDRVYNDKRLTGINTSYSGTGKYEQSYSAVVNKARGVGIQFLPYTPQEMREQTYGMLKQGGIGYLDGGISNEQKIRHDNAVIKTQNALSNGEQFDGRAVQVITNVTKQLSKGNFLNKNEQDNFVKFVDALEKEGVTEETQYLRNLVMDPSSYATDTDTMLINEKKDTPNNLGYANTLSPDELDNVISKDNKNPLPSITMEDFKTVDDYFKSTDKVDFNVTEAFKNLYSTVKGLKTDFLDYAETKLPDPTRLEYTDATIKKSEDDLKELYNEVAPIVKLKTKQLVAEAPPAIKGFMKSVEKATGSFFTNSNKAITSGALTTFAVVDATKYGTELLELAKETAIKTQDKIVEMYDSTEEARKDIKDQAKLMTFYDEITKPNWQAFKRNVVDDYKTFALNNNLNQEDFMKALESVYGPLFEKIQDSSLYPHQLRNNKSLLAPEEKD